MRLTYVLKKLDKFEEEITEDNKFKITYYMER